ncbi:MAG: hypothetical protein BWY99_02724 [Synergistetes bacterium ADurb.BinA166]|nr:MAG: hypothetical protein BWY99_02724 [Synergistetes bacterium ADurb.BinA166]
MEEPYGELSPRRLQGPVDWALSVRLEVEPPEGGGGLSREACEPAADQRAGGAFPKGCADSFGCPLRPEEQFENRTDALREVERFPGVVQQKAFGRDELARPQRRNDGRREAASSESVLRSDLEAAESDAGGVGQPPSPPLLDGEFARRRILLLIALPFRGIVVPGGSGAFRKLPVDCGEVLFCKSIEAGNFRVDGGLLFGEEALPRGDLLDAYGRGGELVGCLGLPAVLAGEFDALLDERVDDGASLLGNGEALDVADLKIDSRVQGRENKFCDT